MQAGADDDAVGAQLDAVGQLDARRRGALAASLRTRVTSAPVRTAPPRSRSSSRERERDGAEVGDRRLGRVQRRDPGGVRLDLAQLGRVEPAQPGHAVRVRALGRAARAAAARVSSSATTSLPHAS